LRWPLLLLLPPWRGHGLLWRPLLLLLLLLLVVVVWLQGRLLHCWLAELMLVLFLAKQLLQQASSCA
jgi:hypothetical protein